MVVVDAFRIPDLIMAQVGVAKADRKESAVAAASIVAKVTRDRLMHSLAVRHPHYAWESNVGYGTPAHLAGLRVRGACVHHRRRFVERVLAAGETDEAAAVSLPFEQTM
jgi:ribonuclease HII